MDARGARDIRTLLVSGAVALVLAGVAAAIAGDCAGRRAARQVVAPRGELPTVPGMGRLEVTSTPPEALVTVDGRLVGKTPIARIDVDVGRHAVVLELAGYQPYVGAVAVVAGRASSLEAVLAPAVGGGGVGGGVAAGAPGAAGAGSADAGPDAAGASAANAAGDAKKAKPSRPAPPPRPRRDCSGERSRCRSGCDDASFDCRSRCQYCGSCVTSMTWDECNRICNTCRQGCEQNERFCESSCDSQEDSCEAANNY